MTYGRGDVVYGDDPFKGEDYSRPWAIISNDTHPFHGDQYIVLGLTTKSWHDRLLAIDDGAWLDGGTPSQAASSPGASKRSNTLMWTSGRAGWTRW